MANFRSVHLGPQVPRAALSPESAARFRPAIRLALLPRSEAGGGDGRRHAALPRADEGRQTPRLLLTCHEVRTTHQHEGSLISIKQAIQ